MTNKRFTILHLFCGSGGGALGFQQSQQEYKGLAGTFETIAGIDVDPECCANFERLTGTPAICMDLFSRQQYMAFHGCEPPADWREVTPADILAACGGRCPDVVFLSPPCKGFSGLLPAASAKSPKYQALNELVPRSMMLVTEAFKGDLPAVIMIENVPRIVQRGKHLLTEVKTVLRSSGYVFHEASHDCGEIGGLGQIRKRYLMIARNPRKLPGFIWQPVKQRHKTIGDVLGQLPPPGDTEKGGAMHRIPRLQWRTWLRLALIPAGGDWRDLQNTFNGKDMYSHCYGVVPWANTSRTVTGASKPNNGAINLADPRLSMSLDSNHFKHCYKVLPLDATSGTITSAHGPSNGVTSIADPRLDKVMGYGNKYMIERYSDPSHTVTGSRIGSGGLIVADQSLGHSPRSGAFRIVPWGSAAPTIVGNTRTGGSNGISGIADPRFTCKQRAGTFGVQQWDEPSKTVIGGLDVHAGAAAVADPRIPGDTDSGVWLIVAEDGTWHRPITTLEMAALQGLPMNFADGSPLVFAGKSEARWREHTGNMVPPPAACAIGNALLETMLPMLAFGEVHWGTTDRELWVQPAYEQGDIVYEQHDEGALS